MLRTLLLGGAAALVLAAAPFGVRADDWEDYWEDRRERLEDLRERQRERYEDWLERRRDWDDDWRDHHRRRGRFYRPYPSYYYGPPVRYWQPLYTPYYRPYPDGYFRFGGPRRGFSIWW